MARQREPAAMIKAKGKSHWSKESLEEREKREPNVNLPNVKPPSYLNTKKQREEFDEIARKLKTISETFFTELDVDVLARYVLAREQYVRCNRELKRLTTQHKFGTREFESALRAQDKAFVQCRACGNDLGLTVTSRCKVEIPQVKEEVQENRFAKFQK